MGETFNAAETISCAAVIVARRVFREHANVSLPNIF